MLGGKERVECPGCGTVVKVRKDAPSPCPACGHSGEMRDPAAVTVVKALSRGLAEVEPVLVRHGFELAARGADREDGGYRATAVYRRDDRAVRLSLRDALGVTYELGGSRLDHAEYMMALLGPTGGNRFPPYLHDPHEGFRALRFDLERFCADLLEGDGEEFLRCCREARQRRDESGFQRLARLVQRHQRRD